jgi:hypothetical protein
MWQAIAPTKMTQLSREVVDHRGHLAAFSHERGAFHRWAGSSLASGLSMRNVNEASPTVGPKVTWIRHSEPSELMRVASSLSLSGRKIAEGRTSRPSLSETSRYEQEAEKPLGCLILPYGITASVREGEKRGCGRWRACSRP